MPLLHCVGSLLGYNVTDVADMTNQYDDYVQNSTLNELAKYVRLIFFLRGYFSSSFVYSIYSSLLALVQLQNLSVWTSLLLH